MDVMSGGGAPGILVFDMDGVLVDVTESYRETICRTVEHFAGRSIPREIVQDYKNRGGWNNDWALSQRICADLGCDVAYDTVVEYFQGLFLGPTGAGDGLIAAERWMAAPGLFAHLRLRWNLAVFTGRPRAEAMITLRRFAPETVFDPIITEDDRLPAKPAPDGLVRISALTGGAQLTYVGDTVDDARSARAAGVPFVGIAAPSNPRHAELAALLAREGAMAVLDDINQLPRVLEATAV
jgi:HAD superfamily phosphatase